MSAEAPERAVVGGGGGEAFPRWLAGAGVAALVVLAALVGRAFEPVAGGADSSGYLNSARLFAEGRWTAPFRLPPEIGEGVPFLHFLPLGFWQGPSPELLAPAYPPGLPLQLALGGLAGGWEAGPEMVALLLAVAAPLLLALAAREAGLSAAGAVAAGAMLAASPVYLFSAIQPLSDLPATTWCLAAVWAALRAGREARSGRTGRSLGWAAGTGVAVTLTVLTRPTGVLLLPALVVLLGRWRLLLAAGAAGLPGAWWLGTYQQTLFGSPFATGYVGIGSALGWEWVPGSLALYAAWLPRVLPAAVLGLALLAPLARGRGPVTLALALWAGAFGGFYAFYAVTHEVWWCLRFVLPAFPALLLAAGLGLEGAAARWGRVGRVAVPAGAAALALWGAAGAWVQWPKLNLGAIPPGELRYREAARWTGEHLPAEAVVSSMATSGALYFYTPLAVLRFDQMTPEHYSGYAARMRAAGRPVYALVFDSELERAREVHGDDRWERVRDFGGLSLWRVGAGKAGVAR